MKRNYNATIKVSLRNRWYWKWMLETIFLYINLDSHELTTGLYHRVVEACFLKSERFIY